VSSILGTLQYDPNDSKLNFSTKPSADQKQASESAKILADARGSDELNHVWGNLGAGTAKKDLSIDSLHESATTVVDKLRSISGDAIERSETYKNLFKMSNEESSNTDIKLDS